MRYCLCHGLPIADLVAKAESEKLSFFTPHYPEPLSKQRGTTFHGAIFLMGPTEDHREHPSKCKFECPTGENIRLDATILGAIQNTWDKAWARRRQEWDDYILDITRTDPRSVPERLWLAEEQETAQLPEGPYSVIFRLRAHQQGSWTHPRSTWSGSKKRLYRQLRELASKARSENPEERPYGHELAPASACRAPPCIRPEGAAAYPWKNLDCPLRNTRAMWSATGRPSARQWIYGPGLPQRELSLPSTRFALDVSVLLDRGVQCQIGSCLTHARDGGDQAAERDPRLCRKRGDKLVEQLFAPPDLRAVPHRQEAFKISHPWVGPAYLDPDRSAPQPGERLRLVPWRAGGYDTTQALKRLRS